MNQTKLMGVLGLLFLSACEVGKGNLNSSSNGGSQDYVDSSGCTTSKVPFGGGTGSSNDPYLLCSVAHLESMAGSSTPAYYALTRDLDMTHEKHRYLGVAIMGVFDGRNHTIRNFTSNLEMDQEGGFLFGQLFSTNTLIAEIKNLRLENFSIQTNSIFGTAALLGTNSGGKITNVHVTGNISGKQLVGGIVATNYGYVQDSSFSGIVEGQTRVGGITAWNRDYLIKNCDVSGSVTGDSAVGGIAGEKEKKATLSENRVTAQVTGTSEFGLIVGRDSP